MKHKPTATRTMTPSWDLLKRSTDLAREHYLGVMWLFFLPSLLSVLGSVMFGTPDFTNENFDLTSQQITGLSLLFVSLLWQIVNLGPLTLFQLRAADKKVSPTVGQFYKDGLGYSLRLVLYYIVFGFMALVGLLLFVVPGLTVIRRYLLAPYYLVDRNLGVRQSLKESGAASKPYRGAIWGIIGVQFAIIVLVAVIQGALPFIGIIIGEVIACTYLFLMALRYREIEPKTTTKKAKTA